MIRSAVSNDAEALTLIYNHYIANTVITFEEMGITTSTMQKRMETVQQSGLPWLVAVKDSVVVGYAYAAIWKERSAFRFAVETTVYLASNTTGAGLGTKLYDALFEKLKTCEVHTAISGITLPNPVSVALHEKMGMQKVAHFEEVGFKFNGWHDVGYWQVQLGSQFVSSLK